MSDSHSKVASFKGRVVGGVVSGWGLDQRDTAQCITCPDEIELSFTVNSSAQRVYDKLFE